MSVQKKNSARAHTRMNKPIRVGFDLDGVILYNPARLARTIVKNFKRKFIPKRENTFYVPGTKPEQFLWEIFHWSSLFIAPGFEDIKKLAQQGIIEPYIVTARFGFMHKSYLNWLKKMKIHHDFKGAYMNTHNEQPHIYKEKMIKRLKLDYFVEDNWDIVSHLSKKTPAKVFWVYNLFDRKIDYKRKVPSLAQAIEHLLEHAHEK